MQTQYRPHVFTLLLPAIQRAVEEEGYTTPTPIQEQAIPPLLEGRDLLGSAQTGTGKTAAFTLPILQHLTQRPRKSARGLPRALILAPTRELAAQIHESIQTYGRHLRITHTVIYGGVGQGPQVGALRRGVDIVVATPGRLLDLMEQGHARLQGIEIFVLDEADRMLDMGFIPDIRRIVAKLPRERQSLFFSATLTPEVLRLAPEMVRDPVHVAIAPEQPTVEKIEQKVLFVGRQNKTALLVHLLKNPELNRVIVFTSMKHAANKLAQKLGNAGIRGSAIHGNKSQNARREALAEFKAGSTRVLVATDIAARGIDVDGITHVINYDLPNEAETYVHRIGRTARAGAAGAAISFCSAEERSTLRDIERLIRKAIPVDLEHDFHCEVSRHAAGESARHRPRGGRQGSGSHSRRAQPHRGSRSFGRIRHRHA